MTDTTLPHLPRAMDAAGFIARYGALYEGSPWIAAAAFKNCRNVTTVDQLHTQLKRVVAEAAPAQQLDLIAAHPDLACAPEELTRLTAASQGEQAGAGLNHCTAAEFAEFQALNRRYREKFGFPFIVAVKGLDRMEILRRFRERLQRDRDQEFDTALQEIHKIAYGRLLALATQGHNKS